MKHKSLKSFISVMLVLCMVIGVCPVIAFAEKETKSVNYVSLGESMSNGYGYELYRENGVDVNAFRQNDVVTSYPYYFTQYLKNDLGYDEVNWEALAVSCMRPEDLNFLLRFDTDDDSAMAQYAVALQRESNSVDNWNNKIKDVWAKTFVDDRGNVMGDYFTFDEFVTSRFNDWGDIYTDETGYPWRSNGTLAYARYFQEKITAADIITLATGNANFGVIMLNNILGAIGTSFGTYKDVYDTETLLTSRIDASILPYVNEVLAKTNEVAKEYVGKLELGEEIADKLLNVFEYTVASFMISYIDVLDAIDDLNDKDNLDIIMLGLMNTMEGVMVDLGEGNVIDFGAYVDEVTNVLSAYYFTVPVLMQEFADKYENFTFYIAPNDRPVEMMVARMTDLEEIKKDNVIRDRLTAQTNENVLGLVSGTINDLVAPLAVGTLDRTNVEAYEAKKAAWNGADKYTVEMGNDDLAAAIYLAVENAVVKNASNATLKLDSIMALTEEDGLAGLFGSVATELSGAITEEAITAKVKEDLLASGIAVTDGTYIYPNTTEGYDETALYGAQARFTKNEIITALENALTDALANNESLSGLFTLFARMLVGNGMGSHPDAVGHQALFETVEEVYPNKPATVKLAELAKIIAEKLYAIGEEYGEDAVNYAINYAVENGYVTKAQLGAVKAGAEKLYAAIAAKNATAALESAEALATMLVAYADEHSDELAVAINALAEGLEIVSEKAYELCKEYGDDVLNYIIHYADKKGFISKEESEEIKANVVALYTAIKNGDNETAFAICRKFANLFAIYAEENFDDIVAFAAAFADGVKEASNFVYEAVVEYGDEVARYMLDFALRHGIITQAQLDELWNKYTTAIAKAKTAAEFVQNKEAVIQACKELAVDLYKYADENGYIPAQVKEYYAKAVELYNQYKDITVEEIKNLLLDELKKLVEEQKAEALIAVESYIVNQGWLPEYAVKELEQKIIDTIAAYKEAPEETAEAALKELAEFLYNEAVKAGYIDVEVVETITNYVDMAKGVYDYFTNTPAEQIKADAIGKLFDAIDYCFAGKVNDKVLTQVKSDIAELVDVVINSTPDTLEENVKAFIEAKLPIYQGLIYKAVHIKFIPQDDSYYVALGSDTLAGTGISRNEYTYFDLLLKELQIEGANLAQKRVLPTQLLKYVTDNAKEIAKADFITYEADASAFILAALSGEEVDWSRYFTEEELNFIQQAIPLIEAILAADWAKYNDVDVVNIAQDIRDEVFANIDSAVKNAYAENSDKLNELYAICVAEVKAFVEYAKEEIEKAAALVIAGLDNLDEIYAIVEAELADNWDEYAAMSAADAAAQIKNVVIAKLNALGETKIDTTKVEQFVKTCVEQIIALHNNIEDQLVAITAGLTDTEMRFAKKAYDAVAEYVLANWPELANLDVIEIHEKVNAEIQRLIKTADEFDADPYVELGKEKATEIVDNCADAVIDAINRTKAVSVVMLAKLDAKYDELVNTIMPAIAEILVEKWNEFCAISVDETIAKVNELLSEKLGQKYDECVQYVEENKDVIGEVIALCVENARPVIQSAQDIKTEVLTVLGSLERFQPVAEKILYAIVAYAVDNAKAIEAILTINPDVALVVVGMYNPLDGIEVVAGGKTIDLGAYVEKFMLATDVYNTALSVANLKYGFVSVPETEIVGVDGVINLDTSSVESLGGKLLDLYEGMNANAAGHEYIFTRIMSAVDTTETAVSGISFASDKVELFMGDKTTLEPIITPDTAINKEVIWTSSREKIATVDENGVVTAHKMGVTEITATTVDGGYAATITVEVSCRKDNTCPAAKFTDVDLTRYYHDGLHFCVDNYPLIVGVTDTLFDPDGTTTRAMVVTILWRLAGSPKVDSEISFTDVETNRWYTEAVRWAEAEGITLGTSAKEKTFSPYENITREQLATMLYRYAKYLGYNVSDTTDLADYADADTISTWALKAVKWANKTGIIVGRTNAEKTETVVAPLENAMRAELVTMIYRYCTWMGLY